MKTYLEYFSTPKKQQEVLYSSFYNSYRILCPSCLYMGLLGDEVKFKIIQCVKFADHVCATVLYKCLGCGRLHVHFLALPNTHSNRAIRDTSSFSVENYLEIQKFLQTYMTQQSADTDTEVSVAIQSAIQNYYFYLTCKYTPRNPKKLLEEISKYDLNYSRYHILKYINLLNSFVDKGEHDIINTSNTCSHLAYMTYLQWTHPAYRLALATLIVGLSLDELTV